MARGKEQDDDERDENAPNDEEGHKLPVTGRDDEPEDEDEASTAPVEPPDGPDAPSSTASS